jgi:hypothetical protein
MLHEEVSAYVQRDVRVLQYWVGDLPEQVEEWSYDRKAELRELYSQQSESFEDLLEAAKPANIARRIEDAKFNMRCYLSSRWEEYMYHHKPLTRKQIVWKMGGGYRGYLKRKVKACFACFKVEAPKRPSFDKSKRPSFSCTSPTMIHIY